MLVTRTGASPGLRVPESVLFFGFDVRYFCQDFQEFRPVAPPGTLLQPLPGFNVLSAGGGEDIGHV